MSESAPLPDTTRTRILEAALGLFAVRGFHRTSVRQIAERLGLTKTAVLYHFPAKADVAAALVEPVLRDIERTLAAIDRTDPYRARWAAIEGLLDVWLTHRHLIRMNLHDMTLLLQEPTIDRYRNGIRLANQLVSGPDPDLDGQVRAAQVVAALSDPVILFADAPAPALRRRVLAGVSRLLDEYPPEVRIARRGAGRPAAMTAERISAAHKMHAAGHTAPEIAASLGVSRATVYRHLRY